MPLPFRSSDWLLAPVCQHAAELPLCLKLGDESCLTYLSWPICILGMKFRPELRPNTPDCDLLLQYVIGIIMLKNIHIVIYTFYLYCNILSFAVIMRAMFVVSILNCQIRFIQHDILKRLCVFV